MTDIFIIIVVIAVLAVLFELSKDWWRETGWRRRHRNRNSRDDD